MQNMNLWPTPCTIGQIHLLAFYLLILYKPEILFICLSDRSSNISTVLKWDLLKMKAASFKTMEHISKNQYM